MKQDVLFQSSAVADGTLELSFLEHIPGKTLWCGARGELLGKLKIK